MSRYKRGIGLSKIHFITSNQGKFKEAKAQIEPLGYELVQENIDYPEVQADTLDEVTMFGMDHLSEVVRGDFLIEDSGLFIGPLEGFPGVYSAYVMKTVGNPGILKLMGDRDERDAVFRSCFGYFSTSKGTTVVSGECKGTISRQERGSGGFGYDPIFIPEGHKRTFAEMPVDEKNGISHRGRAMIALIGLLKAR